MEVSGIEGTFRFTCEAVMRVLREVRVCLLGSHTHRLCGLSPWCQPTHLCQNRDSVMAMLEAFVHDPLINWRLLTPQGDKKTGKKAGKKSKSGDGAAETKGQADEELRRQNSGGSAAAAAPGAGAGAGAGAAAAAGSELASATGGGGGDDEEDDGLSTSVPTAKQLRGGDSVGTCRGSWW